MSKHLCCGCNLKDIKSKIKDQWDEISDEDLVDFKSLEDQISEIIEKRYKVSRRKAHEQVHDFFDFLEDNQEEAEAYLKKIKNFKQHISDLADDMIEQASHEVDALPRYFHKGEEKVIDSIKTHPVQSLGIIAVAGVILGSYLTNRIK